MRLLNELSLLTYLADQAPNLGPERASWFLERISLLVKREGAGIASIPPAVRNVLDGFDRKDAERGTAKVFKSDRVPGDVDKMITHIADWIRDTPTFDPEVLRGYPSLDSLYVAAHNYFESKRRAVLLSDLPKGTEKVFRTKSGMDWVKLTTKDAYENEGNAMGHCVGSYFGLGAVVYSLRDEKGWPHVTAEVNDDVLKQTQTASGADTTKYKKEIEELIEFLGLKVNLARRRPVRRDPPITLRIEGKTLRREKAMERYGDEYRPITYPDGAYWIQPIRVMFRINEYVGRDLRWEARDSDFGYPNTTRIVGRLITPNGTTALSIYGNGPQISIEPEPGFAPEDLREYVADFLNTLNYSGRTLEYLLDRNRHDFNLKVIGKTVYAVPPTEITEELNLKGQFVRITSDYNLPTKRILASRITFDGDPGAVLPPVIESPHRFTAVEVPVERFENVERIAAKEATLSGIDLKGSDLLSKFEGVETLAILGCTNVVFPKNFEVRNLVIVKATGRFDEGVTVGNILISGSEIAGNYGFEAALTDPRGFQTITKRYCWWITHPQEKLLTAFRRRVTMS